MLDRLATTHHLVLVARLQFEPVDWIPFSRRDVTPEGASRASYCRCRDTAPNVLEGVAKVVREIHFDDFETHHQFLLKSARSIKVARIKES